MTRGDWLQVIGALLELVGLLTVAVGISETRRMFGRPSLLGRVWDRIRGRGSVSLTAPGGGIVFHGGDARIVITRPWKKMSTPQKLDALQEMAERAETAIDELHDQIRAEATARAKADDLVRREQDEMRERLEARIEEASAGGLGIETWGVIFFALGAVLQTWGSVIA